MLDKKLKEEADTYEIKTTVDSILNQYHAQKERKKSFGFKFAYCIPVLTCLAVFVIIGLVNSNTHSSLTTNPSTIQPTNTINNHHSVKAQNILSLEVASSLGLIQSEQNIQHSRTMRNQQSTIDIEEFRVVCEEFKKNYTILNESLNFKNENFHEVETGVYNILDQDYTHKVTYSNSEIFYYKIVEVSKDDDDEQEEKYRGVLFVNENLSYPVEGEREKELEDAEIETKVRIKLSETKTLTIEQEIEGTDEYSYSYSIIEGNMETYSLEIDFEQDEIEMNVKEKYDSMEQKIDYSIKHLTSKYLIQYDYSKNDLAYDGEMELVIEGKVFKFKDVETEIVIEI